jgi:hypothetical protein
MAAGLPGQRVNATEKHAELLEHGWTTRADGRMYPPTDWHDTRAYSFRRRLCRTLRPRRRCSADPSLATR